VTDGWNASTGAVGDTGLKRSKGRQGATAKVRGGEGVCAMARGAIERNAVAAAALSCTVAHLEGSSLCKCLQAAEKSDFPDHCHLTLKALALASAICFAFCCTEFS
jgi:hypothetical protein